VFIEDPFFMSEHAQDIFLLDRRSGKDRRCRTLPGIRSLFIYARRQEIRRQEDKYKISYFDQYSPALLTPIVLILLLSIVDAFLTLFLVDVGAREINPIMAYFLKFGPFAFVSVKYFLTCYSVIVLLIFHDVYFRKLKIYTRSLFSCAIGVFVIVIGWELHLMFRILF
jgi:Domain of unknown function (DUF5658)